MRTRKATVAREIRAISIAFRQLARSFAQLTPVLAAAGASPAGASPGAPGGRTAARPRRRKRRLTAAQRAALKLQGRYMGTLRGLKPAHKAKVKKIRIQKGIRAAIAAARRFAS